MYTAIVYVYKITFCKQTKIHIDFFCVLSNIDIANFAPPLHLSGRLPGAKSVLGKIGAKTVLWSHHV